MVALCHPITLWISGVSWVFCCAYFHPRPLGALLPALICLGLFSAWIVRDLQISKTPFGISPFALLEEGAPVKLWRDRLLDSFGGLARKAVAYNV